MLNPLDESALDPIRLTEDSQADASEHKAWIVVTRVLSRPTLETCVIDIGHEITATQATILSPRGASFLMLANDVSSLTLTGPALDLRIGDLVKLQNRLACHAALPFELDGTNSGTENLDPKDPPVQASKTRSRCSLARYALMVRA